MDTRAESPSSYPIDPELATQVNGLTKEQLLSEEFYPVRHQLFYYGLSGVATVHLFRKAQELLLKDPPVITLNEFIGKYELLFTRYWEMKELLLKQTDITPDEFDNEYDRFFAGYGPEGFKGRWRTIAKDGIFVPRCNLDGSHPYASHGTVT